MDGQFKNPRAAGIELHASVSERIWDRGLLVTTLVVTAVSALSVWLAWRASASLALPCAWFALAPALSAASVSYALRVLRLHCFLSRSGVAISLPSALSVQLVGFALGATPGRVGEVFKLHLLRERTGAPIAQTAPLLLLERLTEGGGFMLLALASAPLLPALQTRIPTPALLLLGLAVIVALAATRPWWSQRVVTLDARVMRSQLWQFGAPHLQNLRRGVETSFTLTQILIGLGLSTVARLADGLVVLFVARMLGVELELPEAVFILAVSGLTGGVSFLPAGLGAVETTMVGLLVLVGAAWSHGVAIALVTRLFTLWLWVALGLGAAFLLRLPSFRLRFKRSEER